MCYLLYLFPLHADRAVSLVFRSIDPSDPSRRFTITVDVDENNQWTGESVLSCSRLSMGSACDASDIILHPFLRCKLSHKILRYI